MDKNRIHIDDLVRNRLSGAEEKEPAGAWSSMRDLLEKEMPVETAAFNWRRMLGYATAVILATSVSVGGYNYYRHAASMPANRIAANKINITSSKNTHHEVAGMAAVAANSTPQTLHTVTNQNTSNQSNIHRQQTQRNHDHVVGSTVSRAPVATGARGVVATHSATVIPSEGDSRTPVSTAALVASSNSDLSKPASAINAGKELAADHQLGKAANPSLKSAGNSPLDANQRAASAVDALARNTVTARPIDHPSSTGNNAVQPQQTPVVPASGTTVNGNHDKAAYTFTKDTIKQIEIAYRRSVSEGDRTIHYVKDTLAVTKLVVDKRKPVEVPNTPRPAQSNEVAISTPSLPAPVKHPAAPNMSSSVASAATNPVPQSAAVSNAEAIAATDNIKLVSLSQFRIASKFNNLWNAERFHLMVQNVKADLSRAQFYAGMTGGLNASLFTATAMAGFQAGLTGLLTFNDQWSLAGELKFYQRFNTGNSIKDNYVRKEDWIPGNYTTVNGATYREWTWREDTVAHSFNFTTIQTLELPILLRYNMGRIFAEAGINMMYAFTVNAEEIDRPNGNPSLVSRQMPGNFTPESIGGRPTINSHDFGSRFGLGYALGAGYQLTPALQANVRLVHSVWDNASSVGAGKVSRNLYQTPSIQFSIGYRFKQGKGR